MFGFRPRIGAAVALAMFAFGGVGVSYLNLVFTSMTRFLFVLPVLALLLVHGWLLNGLRGGAGLAATLFFFLAVLSTFWSDVPELSGLKSISYAVIATVFSGAGAFWAQKCARGQELRLFLPLVILVLIASIGGAAVSTASVRMNTYIELYRGLTANSNYLGILALSAIPATLWEFYRPHGDTWRRLIGYSLAPALGLVVLLTFSRASIAAAAIMILCFLLGAGLKRYALITIAAVFSAIVLFVAFPEKIARYETIYVYKGAIGEQSIIASRVKAWDKSLAGADAGGLVGLGFGVSAGFTEFEEGFSTSNYGREKGNTALAVAEELGSVGLVLYVILLVLMFARIYGGVLRARHPHERVMLSIVFGGLAGLVINSQFEAWFLAPGAFGTPVFWSLFGLGLALVSRYDRER